MFSFALFSFSKYSKCLVDSIELYIFQIYSMTLRLGNLFDEQVKKIFKRSSSRANQRRTTNRRHASSSHATSNGGPSTSRQYTRVQRHSSDEEDFVDVVSCFCSIFYSIGFHKLYIYDCRKHHPLARHDQPDRIVQLVEQII